MPVGEQNSLGGERSMPECSKQNIFKCIVCFQKNILTKIFLCILRFSVISKKGLHFRVCPNIFKFARITSKQGVVPPPLLLLRLCLHSKRLSKLFSLCRHKSLNSKLFCIGSISFDDKRIILFAERLTKEFLRNSCSIPATIIYIPT